MTLLKVLILFALADVLLFNIAFMFAWGWKAGSKSNLGGNKQL